jgi:AraC-like DNA-binding protein
MTIETIPVIRAAYLNLFMSVLGQRALSDTALLQRFNLPSNQVESQDAYVPLKNALLFAQSRVGSNNIVDVITQINSNLKVTHFSTELQSALKNSTTLDIAIEQFTKLVNHEQSNVDCKIQRCGGEVHIISATNNMPLSNPELLGEWLQITSLITVIRHFAGHSWTPTKIMLQTQSDLGQKIHSEFPNTQIITRQAETVIVIPASLLTLTKSNYDSTSQATGNSREHSDDTVRYNWDFPTTVQGIVQAYLEDGYPHISFIANVIGCSVRSLQRQLKKFNLSYTDIVQKVRFKLATLLLKNPDIKVIDAALAVGYEDPSHFSRAFKRLTGLSPKQYRNINYTN